MGRRNRPREQRKNQPAGRRNLVIALVAIAAVAIAAALTLPNLLSGKASTLYPNPNGMSLGDPNAPVKIEDYSDFQCPFCADYARNREAGIISEYVTTGKASYTFIPFSFLGEESVRAAEAAYCASDQNKFWEYKQILYENQAAENSGGFADAKLIQYAQRAGLRMAEFRSCFDNSKHHQQVVDDFTTGQQRGVTGTPFFFVNGEGPYNQNDLKAAIEKAVGASN